MFQPDSEEFEPKKVRAPKITKNYKNKERIIPPHKLYKRAKFKRSIKKTLEEEDSAGQEIIDYEIESY